MSDRHWFIRLIVIAGVFMFDHTDPPGQLGLLLAVAYVVLCVFSVFQRDWRMLRKRGFMVALFIIEQIVVTSMAENPPQFELFDKLQKMQ